MVTPSPLTEGHFEGQEPRHTPDSETSTPPVARSTLPSRFAACPASCHFFLLTFPDVVVNTAGKPT